jgi:hypothetical protein
MVAPATLRRRLRRLPGDKPEPSFWLVSILQDGSEVDHNTLEPWPTAAFLNRDQRAPEMVLKLNMGGQA